jgi:acyl-CoA reductase-like NAD-dependent aldehyde dehydrogenase
VTCGAAHQAQRLLRRTVDPRARERGEFLERALESLEASPASLAECVTLDSSGAVDDRTELIAEHRVLGVWADDLRAGVVSHLDQTRQIHGPAQPRELVFP